MHHLAPIPLPTLKGEEHFYVISVQTGIQEFQQIVVRMDTRCLCQRLASPVFPGEDPDNYLPFKGRARMGMGFGSQLAQIEEKIQ
jgi:hypothetical protein